MMQEEILIPERKGDNQGPLPCRQRPRFQDVLKGGDVVIAESPAVGITVSEALKIGPLKRSKLIAGAGGLGNVIRHVTIMDTPDIKKWLKGGEFLLTNVFVIKDDPNAQIELIREISTQQVSALGIKLKRYVETVPAEMLALADQYDLPIIEIPIDCAWIDVMNPVITEILNRQLALLKHSERIHRELTRITLTGGGVDRIARNLAELLESPVVILDERLSLLAVSPATGGGNGGIAERDCSLFKEELLAELAQCLSCRDSREIPLSSIELGNKDKWIAFPIQSESTIYGWISVANRNRPLSEWDLVAVEQAAMVAALEMVKARAVRETERRFRNDFLHDLLSGSIKSEETAIQRARFLDINLQGRFAVMIVDIDRFQEYSGHLMGSPEGETRMQHLKEGFLRAVKSLVSGYAKHSIFMDRSDSIAVLLPVTGEAVDSSKQAIMDLANQVRKGVNNALKDVTVSVGVGRTCDRVTDLHQSYTQAKQALLYGRNVWGRNHTFHFDDLGVYRLLCRYPDRGELNVFCQEMIGPLIEYDKVNSSDLIESLEKYFVNDGDIPRTSAALFVHPNTLRYRLRRIEKILGEDLSSGETRGNLFVAIKIWRLLQAGRYES